MLFNPKTEKIKQLAQKFAHRILELEQVFNKPTNVYIDYANVKPWSTKLGWHIDIKRLKQFLESFENVRSIKFYSGTLIGDEESENFITKTKEFFGENLKTKPVKILKLSIDVSSVASDSPDILKEHIRKPLLQKLKIEAIGFLNRQLKELNDQGILFVEDLKCNFDVEIGRDMLLDYAKNDVDNFALWSGDSDFADPIKQLIADGKKVIIFATARRISSELNVLRKDGLRIFDIQKIRNFICWKREIYLVNEAKGTSFEAPKR